MRAQVFNRFVGFNPVRFLKGFPYPSNQKFNAQYKIVVTLTLMTPP